MFGGNLTFYYKNNIYKPTNNFPPVHKNNTAKSLSSKTCLTFRKTNYRNGVSHLDLLCHYFQITCNALYYAEIFHINNLVKNLKLAVSLVDSWSQVKMAKICFACNIRTIFPDILDNTTSLRSFMFS